MITSADLQNRAAGPETIRGEHAVKAAIERVKGPPRLTPSAIAAVLDAAERSGEAADEPEGSRVVVLSDTVARRIAAALRRDQPA